MVIPQKKKKSRLSRTPRFLKFSVHHMEKEMATINSWSFACHPLVFIFCLFSTLPYPSANLQQARSEKSERKDRTQKSIEKETLSGKRTFVEEKIVILCDFLIISFTILWFLSIRKSTALFPINARQKCLNMQARIQFPVVGSSFKCLSRPSYFFKV